MKKIAILLFIISILNADIKELISSIEQIKKSKAHQSSQISSIYNPFLNYNDKVGIKTNFKLSTENRGEKPLSQLSLEVIFNNKAKINSKWYTKGDKIGKITIWKILSDKVILKDKKKYIVLYIKSNDILKVSK
jgi:hypothetical protein